MNDVKHNRRKHQRFAATAFINTPVILKPLPPYFGSVQKGLLIDLSAGGLAVSIKNQIPLSTRLHLLMTFPDESTILGDVNVIRVVPRGKNYLHGFEFMELSTEMVNKIERMSSDYINCDMRIRSRISPACRADCAFYSMCKKAERYEPVPDPALISLELAFEELGKSPLLL